jgi:hypothetical protein
MSEIDHTIEYMMKDRDKPSEKETKDSVPPVTAPDREPGPTIILWSLAIIAVIIGLIFLIKFIPTFGDNPNVVEYNEFPFEKREGFWWSLWERDGLQFILSLRYNPYETLNVTVEGEVNRKFERDTIYMTFDPTVDPQTYVALTAAELSLNLAKALGVEVVAACTLNETDACIGRPIVNCGDENISVILLQETNDTATLTFHEECLEVKGNELEMVRAADRALYTFYGIIPSFLDRE